MTDGFGNYPFGDEPFGGFGFQPPGQRAGLRRSSWASTPRAWRSDSNASVLEPLDPAEPYRATAAYNEDTATKRSATLDVANPDSLRELQDYVVLSLDVADDTGAVTTIPLGHYVVIGHDISMDNTARTGTVHLRDRTYLLHLTAMDPAYVVDTGEDSGAAARSAK